jgi:hypothetical protein
VGLAHSYAKFHLRSHVEVTELLEQLAAK